ncbi:MAG: UDP-N-acetylenolpyruvoylglucosamine reductase [Epulopiscium sp. Nele67-Bin002]|nr:MAG: UDP-N-acetylenolpyruvoylglucosamine reductase [Epulopiscium sp. Nuni2H_MBin001]OON92220.1 MAG: UDP-N-acetylenolpyruvoylglucosamine reductase [Epulopiscium sp. Nele67-Bin002]OON93931.1 MAG: UDP-N-acetylenolpyruvoylglucosamine reductase [Epulopiscium sp. Nele67-Bin001]
MDNKIDLINLILEHTTDVKVDEPLSKHTSFRIGGEAQIFVTPTSIESLQAIIDICLKNNVEYYVLGNGSNVLVSDKGFDGVIVSIYKNLSDIIVSENKITAQAGALLSKIAKQAEEASLGGFEFAHGIPGTLGGAITMNAGAYDGEIKDVLESVVVLTIDGQIKKLLAAELELGYRTSKIPDEKYIVLEATISLTNKPQSEISEKMKDFASRRRDKQPLNYPSAGSTFKRPPGHFAGKLIMDSGFAGYTVGGAQVSSKHCGFVINVGNATCEDVLNLIEQVQKKVWQDYQVQLQPEIKLIGVK